MKESILLNGSCQLKRKFIIVQKWFFQCLFSAVLIIVFCCFNNCFLHVGFFLRCNPFFHFWRYVNICFKNYFRFLYFRFLTGWIFKLYDFLNKRVVFLPQPLSTTGIYRWTSLLRGILYWVMMEPNSRTTEICLSKGLMK
jgi:hypothetical protein